MQVVGPLLDGKDTWEGYSKGEDMSTKVRDPGENGKRTVRGEEEKTWIERMLLA